MQRLRAASVISGWKPAGGSGRPDCFAPTRAKMRAVQAGLLVNTSASPSGHEVAFFFELRFVAGEEPSGLEPLLLVEEDWPEDRQRTEAHWVRVADLRSGARKTSPPDLLDVISTARPQGRLAPPPRGSGVRDGLRYREHGRDDACPQHTTAAGGGAGRPENRSNTARSVAFHPSAVSHRSVVTTSSACRRK